MVTGVQTCALPISGIGAAQQEKLVSGLGTASDAAHLPPVAVQAAHDAFIHALASGMWLSAGVAALGAVISFVAIGSKADAPLQRPDVPEAAGVPAAEGPYPATQPEAAAATAEAA